MNNASRTANSCLYHILISILLTLYLHVSIECRGAKPEVCIIAFVSRLLVDMHTPYIFQQFFIKCLNVLVMGNVVIKYRHLSATDTCAYIRHTIIIANGSMLIVRISIACLYSIPHDAIGILPITAYQRATA